MEATTTQFPSNINSFTVLRSRMSGLAFVHFRQISRVCFLYEIIYWAFGTYMRSLSRPKFPMSFAGLTSIICIFQVCVFSPFYKCFFFFFFSVRFSKI